MNSTLEYLKNKQLIWHATQAKEAARLDSSGFAELDEQLGGGLPEQGVVDIQSPVGIGELRLLLPYLKQRQDRGLLVFIAPPMSLNSEMFADFGLALENILIIQANTEQERLWSAEQCLKSACCQSVLMWHKMAEIHHIRRLQLAAEKGGSLQLVLRPHQSSSIPLPVSLGLKLAAHAHGIEVHITKRKGGWPGPPFVVNMARHWPQLTLTTATNNILLFPRAHVS
jgi:hypothetical protein